MPSTSSPSETLAESICKAMHGAKSRKPTSRIELKKLVVLRRKAEPNAKIYNKTLADLVTKGLLKQDKQSFRCTPSLVKHVEGKSKAIEKAKAIKATAKAKKSVKKVKKTSATKAKKPA